MENIKTKRIRGRPSVKKMVETIEEQIKGQEKSNIELVIDEPVESTFLDELNNENFNQGLYHVEEEDEYEEDSDDVIEEIPEEQNDDEPSYQSIAFINKLNLQRADNNIKPKNNIQKHRKNDDDEDIYSKKPTVIQGETKLLLINKITQYKQLFKQELKSFKIKKNPSEEELQAYLDEINVIISIGSIDTFIIDSLLSSVKMIEGVTSHTKFDVTGLADILKSNPQFNNLIKILYLKYGAFSAVPPESQLLFVVATSTYICIQTNSKKKLLFKQNLNEPMLI